MPPGSSTVEFELVPEGTGTLIRLTHRGIPGEDVPIHRSGWERFVARLATAATGRDPEPAP